MFCHLKIVTGNIVEMWGYNAMIHESNFFYQPIRCDLKRYDDIRKIATVHGDDYKTIYNSKNIIC